MKQAVRRLMFGEEGIAGAALVEFTIIAPMLIIMSIYIMDFGLLFYNKIEMQNAAQAGAQWAIANRVVNYTDIQVAAQNATNLPASAISVSSNQFCGCSKDSLGHAAVTQLSSTPCTGSTNALNSTCNTTGVVGNYVAVTATSATPYHSFVPYGLISSSYTISATTTARTQ